MISIIKKYSAVLKINWIQALEYRANAVVGMIAIISGLLIEYQIWSLIYKTKGSTKINGFYFEELIVFIFLSIIVGQLKSSWHTSGEMIEGIRTGDINKFLIPALANSDYSGTDKDYFNRFFKYYLGFFYTLDMDKQEITKLTLDAVGHHGLPYQPEYLKPGSNETPLSASYAVNAAPKYFNYRKTTIYGGSNEIQKNILAKMVLGL